MTGKKDLSNNMRVVEVSSQYPRLQYQEEAIEDFFNYLDTLEGYTLPQGDISIAFLSDTALARLHEDFMEDPSPTDVITFPGDPDMHFAGEICVSVDCAERVAGEHSNTFSEELTLYLIHGWLHLCGYDDIGLQDQQKMRAAEKDVLSKIVKNSPNFSLSV